MQTNFAGHYFSQTWKITTSEIIDNEICVVVLDSKKKKKKKNLQNNI